MRGPGNTETLALTLGSVRPADLGAAAVYPVVRSALAQTKNMGFVDPFGPTRLLAIVTGSTPHLRFGEASRLSAKPEKFKPT